jgi:hypothetical protein
MPYASRTGIKSLVFPEFKVNDWVETDKLAGVESFAVGRPLCLNSNQEGRGRSPTPGF